MSPYFLNFDKFDYVRGSKFDGCILCGIIESCPELVDLTVHTGKYHCVSVNLYPYNPGHLMIYPKRHLINIREYSPAEVEELHSLQILCMDALDNLQSPQAYNLGYNMGPSAGGSIDHLHLHIIPRYNREVGISDLLAGKRILIESPFESQRRIKAEIKQLTANLSSSK